MSDIIVAIIAAVAAVLGSALVQSRSIAVLQEKVNTLQRQLDNLITEQKKYNNLQERVVKLEAEHEETHH